MCEIVFPPLALALTIVQSGDRHEALTGVGDLLRFGPGRRGNVEMPGVSVEFCHTPFPGDWRNRRQIERRLRLDGSPESN